MYCHNEIASGWGHGSICPQSGESFGSEHSQKLRKFFSDRIEQSRYSLSEKESFRR